MFFILAPAYGAGAAPIGTIVAYAGAAAIVWGSFMAMSQKELKRMLAYSSVAQVGYIALGIGLGSRYGLIGAVLHILNHACMKACLFLVTGNLRRNVGHSYLPNLDASVRREMPWSMAAFSIAAVSMIGLPPTAGFFSKWYLAKGALEQDRWILLATLLASTLMNAVYFVRIFEQGEVGTTPYFTMELIDGETLESRLRRSGALEPRSAVRCILGVADALDLEFGF